MAAGRGLPGRLPGGGDHVLPGPAVEDEPAEGHVPHPGVGGGRQDHVHGVAAAGAEVHHGQVELAVQPEQEVDAPVEGLLAGDELAAAGVAGQQGQAALRFDGGVRGSLAQLVPERVPGLVVALGRRLPLQVLDVRLRVLEQDDLLAPREHGQARIEVRARADVDTPHRVRDPADEAPAEVIAHQPHDQQIDFERSAVVEVDVDLGIELRPRRVGVAIHHRPVVFPVPSVPDKTLPSARLSSRTSAGGAESAGIRTVNRCRTPGEPGIRPAPDEEAHGRRTSALRRQNTTRPCWERV